MPDDKYDFEWDDQHDPIKLSNYSECPNENGIYELGEIVDEIFVELYVGRAIGVSLKDRLSKHYRNSHNEEIKRDRDTLHFRTKQYDDPGAAAVVEALFIAAFDYPFNKRNDWREHWDEHWEVEN